MIRPAQAGDEAAMEAWLARDVAHTMFLRSNLAQHGLGARTHPHATDYHLWQGVGGLAGILGVTRAGMVLAHGPHEAGFIAAAAGVLAGRALAGFSGDAALTGALCEALGLPAGAFRRNAVEPLFLLDLRMLAPGGGTVRPARPEDRALLTGWFAAYMAETGLGTGDRQAGIAEAGARADAAVSGDTTVRLLLQDGQPVAMAGLNAQAGDAVQVGGVYVPPGLRNRGLGRAVTRALLAEARSRGARHGVLFANNAAAARAYVALGFQQAGTYRIAFLNQTDTAT